jgi:hypothetical protein
MKLCVVACVVFVALTVFACTQSTPLPEPEPEAPTNKLIGVWRYAELVDTDLDIPEEAREIEADWYMVFTEKYRFVVGSRIPNRQELPENPTDSQLVAAWEPVTAMVSTYEVKENKIINRLVFAKNPNWTPGGEHSYPLKFDGDDLIWTYGVNGNKVTQRYTRLE